MTVNATLNCNEPIFDETLATKLRAVFAAETSKPSNKVLDFIFGFAAAYESVGTGLFGAVDVMKN